MSLTLTVTLSVLGGLSALLLSLLLRPRTASAHCDTMDGPTVQDGRRALATGNAHVALKWVPEDGAAELNEIFEQARAARRLGDAAERVADQWFLENLVRIHRAGEGVPYTGIQPAGAPVDERVRAADEAVATGTLAPLVGLVPDEQVAELEARLREVLARQDGADDDVTAGRSYLEAYVRFFKLAEGHGAEHNHHHTHQHA